MPGPIVIGWAPIGVFKLMPGGKFSPDIADPTDTSGIYVLGNLRIVTGSRIDNYAVAADSEKVFIACYDGAGGYNMPAWPWVPKLRIGGRDLRFLREQMQTFLDDWLGENC